MDRLMRKTKRKNNSPVYKANVALEAVDISTWKRVAIKNMLTAFSKLEGDPWQANEAKIDRLHLTEALISQSDQIKHLRSCA